MNIFQNKKAAKHESIVIAARPSLLPLRRLHSQTLDKIQFLIDYHNHPFLSINKSNFTDFGQFRCVLPKCIDIIALHIYRTIALWCSLVPPAISLNN